MSKKGDKEYWNRRVLVDKARIINNAEKYLQEHQAKLYGAAEKEIQQEVEKLYQKFSDQQKVSLAEARQLIRDADFRKIDWEEMIQESLELREQIRNGKGSLPEEVIQAMEEQHRKLEARMAAYTKRGEISYLELRRVEIDRKLLKLYDTQQRDIYDFLASEYDDGYYRQVFNTQQRIGFGKDFVKPNAAAVDKAILNQYQRRNYSQTLYAHCEHFSKDLKENLVTGLIRGENLERMAGRIQKRMGVARSAARRLVRTETAYVYEQATKDAYVECGIEEYEYLATLDNRTSEVCQKLDGKHYKVKDAMPGKNYPPMHPNCRSTTVCYFPFEKEKKKQSIRLAKDDSGKYYEVPADMTYRQWQKQISQTESIAAKLGDKAYKDIENRIANAPENIQKVWKRYINQCRIKDGEYKGIAHYNRETKGIYLNKADIMKDSKIDIGRGMETWSGAYDMFFHELGHHISGLWCDEHKIPIGGDIADFWRSRKQYRDNADKTGYTLTEILVKEGRDYLDSITHELREMAKENGLSANKISARMVYDKVSDELTDKPIITTRDVTDIWEGITKGKTQGYVSHIAANPKYWDSISVGTEAFAEMFDAAINNSGSLAEIKRYFPKSYELFEEIMEDIGNE